MLDGHNSFVNKRKSYAREILQENEHAEISICIIAPDESDSPQFSIPTIDELAALVVSNLTLEAPSQDIITHYRGNDL